ncbi:hypothetical protein QM012_006915 [Aureobasidium pullulans]|uniref:Uncharacterized protein n=1 Tax=Aureobasidium pullulans TaxID=5580 RepID=A0ABR0TRE3_AURPU
MAPLQDPQKHYNMVDVSHAATLRTETATLQEDKVHEQIDKDIPVTDRARPRTRNHQINHSAPYAQEETTTTSNPQDQTPPNEVLALRKRLEQEDLLRSHNLTTLSKQFHNEDTRHSTFTNNFRSHLIDLSFAHRETLHEAPKTVHNNQDLSVNGVATAGPKQGYIAKWLEGLKSISTSSGLRESSGTSEGRSSVEVVAAKDAKGKGKGIRIVSDGVEEGGVVGGDV